MFKSLTVRLIRKANPLRFFLIFFKFLIDSHGYKFNDVNDKLYSKQSTNKIN